MQSATEAMGEDNLANWRKSGPLFSGTVRIGMLVFDHVLALTMCKSDPISPQDKHGRTWLVGHGNSSMCMTPKGIVMVVRVGREEKVLRASLPSLRTTSDVSPEGYPKGVKRPFELAHTAHFQSHQEGQLPRPVRLNTAMGIQTRTWALMCRLLVLRGLKAAWFEESG